MRSSSRTLWFLFIVSVFNYADRFVLSVLLPAIKADLELSDSELGLLSTFFTVSYVILGIPLARIADLHSRRIVISVSVAIWSLMTAACGLAQNFVQLAAARTLVGVGEAGATPPSHSMISDLFPKAERGRAIAIFSIGAPVGIMLGFLLASAIVDAYGWRMAFVALGLPGIVFALVFLRAVEEPPRAKPAGEIREVPKEEVLRWPLNWWQSLFSFWRSLMSLLRSPPYRHMCFGTAHYTVVYIAVLSWLPSYFTRSFDLSISAIGAIMAVGLGFPQLIGMWLSGTLTDRWVARDARWFSWIPALAMVLSTPLFALLFISQSIWVAAIALFFAFLISIFQGPASLTAIQGLAPPHLRALAAAVFFLIVNLLGAGLGPFLTGAISDAIAADYGEASLRWALLGVCVVFGSFAALHYALVARTIRAELQPGD